MKQIYFKRFIVLICFVIGTKVVFSQNLPTVGKEFWVGYMKNMTTDTNVVLRLFVSSDYTTTGTVSIPLQGWSQPFSVVPGAVTTVTVPSSLAHSLLNGVIDNKGVHILTQDTVSVFAINFRNFSSDATKVLPKKSLGTDYIVSSYTGVGINQHASEFLILATEDNSQITITPTVATASGNPAGVPFTILLDEGETYQVRAINSTSNLTGTTIIGTLLNGPCRPFAVFSGAECAFVPTGCTACDHIYDQLLPTQSWGTEYFVVPFSGATSYAYQVLARENGTQVSIDGGPTFTLNAGQYSIDNVAVGAKSISSNKRIAVTQFMKGFACGNYGDPTMILLNSNNQKISKVTFATVVSSVITTHLLNIVVETSDIGTVLLNNIAIPVSSFSPFAANPANSFAQLTLTQGSHSLEAPNGFTAYVYGLGTAESYGYSVGSYQKDAPIVYDSILCTNDSTLLSPPFPLLSPQWTTLSDSITILGSTNNLLLVPPFPSDVYIITGNSPISGCEYNFFYGVGGEDTIPLVASADNDTVCRFSDVQLTASVGMVGSFEFEWSPPQYFDDPTSATPILNAVTSGWYVVSATTLGSNCTQSFDSVYIHVSNGSIGDVSISSTVSTLCFGDTLGLQSNVSQMSGFDNFNSGLNSSMWGASNGYIFSDICGSVTGNALFFNGATNRTLSSLNLNTSQGGSVNFALKIANGSAPCEDADVGENVLFQYSTNNGASWITLSTLFENSFPLMVPVSVPIPLAAQTPSTRFRWTQPNFTGIGQDVWSLDDVYFLLNDTTGLTLSWTSAGVPIGSGFTNFTTVPAQDSWYTLQVNQGGCIYSDSIFVEFNEFNVNAGSDTILCSATSYQLNATTNAISPSYSWTNALYLDNSSLPNPTLLQDTTMSFVLTVNDGLCSFSDSVTVTFVQSTQSSIYLDSTICEGDSIALDLSGFSGISWTPTTGMTNPTGTIAVFHPTITQTYVVNYLFSGGCVLQDSIHISVIPKPQITFPNDTILCAGVNLSLQPLVNTTLPIIYNWSTGSSLPAVSVSDSGFYRLSVSSACHLVSDSIRIDYNLFNVNAGMDSALCSTLGYVLNATSNATNPVISWTNSSFLNNTTTLNPIVQIDSTLRFVLSVTSGNCTYSDSVDVAYLLANWIGISMDSTICLGDSIVLSMTGNSGITFLPNTGASNAAGTLIFSPVNNQNYMLNYTESQGCQVTDSIYILVNQLPIVSVSNDVTVCLGTPVNLTSSINSVSSPMYLWSTGATSTSLSVVDSGYYFLAVSTSCGTSVDSVLVSYFSTSFSTLPQDTAICNGEVLNLEITIPVGGTALWSDNSSDSLLIFNANSVLATTVWVALTDSNLCLVTDTIVISTHPILPLDLGADVVLCDYDSLLIDVSSPMAVSYFWIPTGSTLPTIVIHNSGTYGVDILDLNNCQYQDSFTVNEVAAPNPVIEGVTELCFGEQAIFTVQESFIGYNWSWGSTDPIGNYTVNQPLIWVTVLDSNNCSGSDTMLLTVVPVPVISLPSVVYLCDTTAIEVTAFLQDALYYVWSNQMVGSTIVVGQGSYTVSAFSICEVEATVEVKIGTTQFDLGSDQIICGDDQIQLTASADSYDSLIWMDGTHGESFFYKQIIQPNDTIYVSATVFGCGSIHDTVQFFIEDCNCPVFVPNTFTPDGNELNQAFKTYSDCPVESLEMVVFNRWGEPVFVSNNPSFEWDGTFNGQLVPNGVYSWALTYKLSSDLVGAHINRRTGHVNVIR